MINKLIKTSISRGVNSAWRNERNAMARDQLVQKGRIRSSAVDRMCNRKSRRSVVTGIMSEYGTAYVKVKFIKLSITYTLLRQPDSNFTAAFSKSAAHFNRSIL